MQPLVLAIEPDLRQAAIVKRIVREKVLADVTVVDSRDAALEAMRTMVPDVLLLSALLSPRDEDELVAHLRTLEHAGHLQTHTIPQLASANGHEEKPSRGLLAAFRRRKDTGSAPAGCDPELFADEVRTYLQRASEKKREMRDAALNPVVPAGMPAKPAQPPAAPAGETASAASPSSWDSPFEWRPTRETKAVVVPRPEPVVAAPPEPVVVASPESAAVASPEPAAVAAPEPAAVAAPEAVAVPPPEFVAVPSPDDVVVHRPELVALTRRDPVLTPVPVVARPRLPLVKRHAHEWWFEEEDAAAPRQDTDSELRNVLASLSVPLHVAAFAYPDGCRIRRVRLQAD